MNTFSQSIQAVLISHPQIKKIIIAYSGGVDSHVLLHICAQMQTQLQPIKITAVSIDHSLHVDSVKWLAHCLKTSDELGVSFAGVKVAVDEVKRDGLEGAARKARYTALENFVDAETVLLTAQHQDDQAETLMLQLFRGCGVQGLASMPTSTAFVAGFLARPFLAIERSDILAYAKQHNLDWLEDPSNTELKHDRNYLRSAIIPLIKKRWPSFSKTSARTALHCAEASDLLATMADSFVNKEKPTVFDLLAIDQKTDELQRAVLRQWLFNNGVKPPSTQQLNQLLHHVAHAAEEKKPVLKIAGAEVRRFRQRLYLMPCLPKPPVELNQEWAADICVLPAPLGELTKKACVGSGVKVQNGTSRVSVRLHCGGERIKLYGRSGTHKLKNLLNEIALPFWLRERLPLIYIGDELAAVAGFWVSEEFMASGDEEGYKIHWAHPDLSF